MDQKEIVAAEAKRYQTGNDFGGLNYNDTEQMLLQEIALFLKRRDTEHRVSYVDGVRPKHYMMLYAKAAAALYETAKGLHEANLHSRALVKDIGEWLRVLTGYRFQNADCLSRQKLLEQKPEEAIDVEPSDG